jgi:hypothetical protein
MPIMLQQGFELLAGKLFMLLITSLAFFFLVVTRRYGRTAALRLLVQP